MAHVKSGGGKQKNGRDSNSKRLGVKRFWRAIRPGGIHSRSSAGNEISSR